MDPQTAGIIKAVIYSAGAFGIVYPTTKHWYLKRKSDNETCVERGEAERKLIETRGEVLKKLSENPNLQQHLKKREELTQKLIHEHPEIIKDNKMGTLDATIRIMVGNFYPENWELLL